jgi:hypothetical protein
MSSRAASRIVIGAGLAAVFGVGVALILEQGSKIPAPDHAETAAAATAPAPAAPPAPDSAASLRDSGTAATPPGATSAPAAAASPPAAPPQSALNGGAASDMGQGSASGADANAPKPKHTTRRAQSTATAKNSSAAPSDSGLDNARTDSGAAAPTSASPPVAGDAAPSSDVPAPTGTTGSDGQITAQVRSSIASLAPGSNIDVTATSGNVALAGSVPSQDVVEQARQAAQQVPGVRQVDTSALLVRNQ